MAQQKLPRPGTGVVEQKRPRLPSEAGDRGGATEATSAGDRGGGTEATSLTERGRDRDGSSSEHPLITLWRRYAVSKCCIVHPGNYMLLERTLNIPYMLKP